MFKNISLWQILIVVLIIVLLFGARKLPDLASSVGKSLKIFKKEINELRDDDDEDPAAQSQPGAQSSSTSTSSTSTSTPPPGDSEVRGTSASTPGGSDSSR